MRVMDCCGLQDYEYSPHAFKFVSYAKQGEAFFILLVAVGSILELFLEFYERGRWSYLKR
ncbi:MAG: hypothetical protein IJ950_05725 [Helicobacter sp.]|nr:hypothetical protein [Helicobacter sp.]